MSTAYFQGKVVVVTGAGSGIGRALALELAGCGARLALSDINDEGLAGTIALLPQGVEARGYRVDVSRREEVFAHADAVKRDFGTAHVVINNAGVALIGTVDHTSIEEFEWQLGINLWGVIYGTKAFLPMLLAQNEGHIVNLSSVFGLVTVPCHSAYHVSKFGVRGFTECLSRELERSKVNATCVHPGGIRTAIASSGRFVAKAGKFEEALHRNYPKLLTTAPEECARVILAGVARGRKRIVVGANSHLLDWTQRLFPVGYGTVLRRLRGL